MADSNQVSAFEYVKRLFGGGGQQPAGQPIASGTVSAGTYTGSSLSPEQEQRAKEEEAKIVSQAQAPLTQPQRSQGTPSLSGMGTIAIPDNPEDEIYIYPEQDRKAKYEDATKKRMKANTMIAFMLANPKYQKLPAHVRDADRDALKALLDEEIPPINSFEKDFPQVEDLAKSIENPYRRRVNATMELGGQIKRINSVIEKYGKDSKKTMNILVPELMGMLKIYNTALSGTSDALSQAEVGRLSPELNPNIFDLTKANKIAGSVFGSKIVDFKTKLESLHDILIEETNKAWNTVAVQSSPEFANKRLGPIFERPIGENITPRFEGKIPKRVASGALAYENYIKNRQAMLADLMPKAESTKTLILSSANLPFEEKKKRLQELNKRFNQATGRELDLPVEYLIPTEK